MDKSRLLPMYLLLLLVFLIESPTNAQRNQKTVEQSFVASRVSFQGWNHDSFPEADPKFDARTSALISRNVLQLAQDIGKSLLRNSHKKTEVFSPLSIYGALSLLLLGSNGQTFEELMRLLKFNQDPYLYTNPWKIHEEFGLMIDDIGKDFPNPRHKRPSYFWQTNRAPLGDVTTSYKPKINANFSQTISIANGLFVQSGYSIRPDFQDAIQGVYHSVMKDLDFTQNPSEATRYINDWVYEKTNGKIKQIIGNTLEPETKVIMASALYFKAMWDKTFIEGATQPRSFYPDGVNHAPITVEMMAHGGYFPYYDAREYDCQILGLPYQKNLTTMYIIVPNNSNRYRLRQLQAELTADKIEDMISKMQWRSTILLFPKLHIENEVNVDDFLNELGVPSLLNQGRSDLSLISTGQEYLNTWIPPKPNGNILGNSFAPIGSVNNFLPPRYPGADDSINDDPFVFSSRFGDEDNDSDNGTTIKDTTTTVTETPRSRPINITTTTESKTITTTEADEDTKTTIITTATEKMPTKRTKRSVVKYKVPSEFHPAQEPLRLKDFVLGKRITKSYPHKKQISRGRRQISPWLNDPSFSLKNLDVLRSRAVANRLVNPGLYVAKIIHKIDLTVNEQGTEGGAATVTTLRRSGTDVVLRVETPFMFIIRHDDTRLPLFYGTVYEPTNY